MTYGVPSPVERPPTTKTPCANACREARWPRGLRQARTLLVGMILLLLVGLAALAGLPHLNLRRPCPALTTMARVLGLSQLTLAPSGRPWRLPEGLHPGVDLRFAPGLIALDADLKSGSVFRVIDPGTDVPSPP